ncbi:MAG TPA: hypothetical protein VNL98_06695 [Gemmatimonadales bacterium]|nr:hypothetical protein [Gemmatimonadales bacterium]
MRTRAELAGYDLSIDEHHLALVCVDCATEQDALCGAKVYVGDEWGDTTGHSDRCVRCGSPLPLDVIDAR